MNKKLDIVYFRYIIKTKSGLTYYDISLREYIRRCKKDILIGISFAEYEWLNINNPILLINKN